MPTLKDLKNYLNNEIQPLEFINKSPDLDTATISGTVDRCIRDAVTDFNMYETIVQSAEVDAADVIDVSTEFAGDVVGIVSVLPETDDIINILNIAESKGELRFPANFDKLTGEPDPNNELINMVQQFDLFEQVESYFGVDFAWKEQDNKLYFDNYDTDIETFFVTVVSNLDDDLDGTTMEDINITDNYTWGWIRRYARAKLFERFGRLLQTGEQSVDINVGGSDMKNEGRQDQEKLLKELQDQEPIFS